MRITLMICVGLSILASSFASGQDETYRGMDLDKRFGIQFEVCTLREGKTLAQVEQLNSKFNQILTEIESNGTGLRLTPFYSHGTPQNPSADFIDIFVGPIEEFGNTWTAFMASNDGPKVYQQFQKLAKCHNRFAFGTPKMTDVQQMLSTNERVITFNWCSAKEGVTQNQLRAKHDAWLAANKGSFQAAAWSIIEPQQGAGLYHGRFAHMNVFTSLNQMFANEEWIANGGGLAGIDDYYSAYASCDGNSSYVGTDIYRAPN